MYDVCYHLTDYILQEGSLSADLYRILGVSKTSTVSEIKAAYRRIAKECHPDAVGNDPKLLARFKEAQRAYDVLKDSQKRDRYDNRGKSRGGSFFDAFQRRAKKAAAESGRSEGRKGANAQDLEGLFSDFGATPRRPSAPVDFDQYEAPSRGGDIEIIASISMVLALTGGSVTVDYRRVQRDDKWRPGSLGPGLVEIEELADVRLIPGTTDGEVLREVGLGHAGANGGGYGDLLVTIRIGKAQEEHSNTDQVRTDAVSQQVPLVLSVDQALLGGKVGIDLPTGTGKVTVTIPPCTSSGAKLRLANRGVSSTGAQVDLLLVVQIKTPDSLDARSIELIEEFAQRNG